MAITPSVNDSNDAAAPSTVCRVGLFGGTFDPVHFGHLRPAMELAEQYKLSSMGLLPNHRPVHRDPASASTAQRISMLQLAVQHSPSLVVDTREALRESPSYSFETLAAVHREQPSATLIFFMGIDAFASFDTWHNWQGILDIANVVVVQRPDSAHSDFSSQLLARQCQRFGDRILDGKTGVIEQAQVTQIAISATQIRKSINEGHSVQFLLPEVVREYILREGLYSGVQEISTD